VFQVTPAKPPHPPKPGPRSKKPREPKIEITIGVMCYPRNDELTAQIVRMMAISAAKFLKPADAERIQADVDGWLKKLLEVKA
jgi:hypothetical protein